MLGRVATRAAAALGLLPPLLLLAGCAAAPWREPAPSPVPPEASQALAAARALLREGAAEDDPELARALARARGLAPEWVAVERLADDLELRSLRAVEALERRRAALRRDPSDARGTYLVGRLEGGAGALRFARAASLAPELAWAHHGLAFAAAAAGQHADAARHERRALALARDPWEQAFFGVALARYQADAGRPAAGVELLVELLDGLELSASDRTWLAVETALAELRQPRPEVRARGYERGLEILFERDPGEADMQRLSGAMRMLGLEHDWRGLRLQLALAARDGPERERERARDLLARTDPGGAPLAVALLLRALEGSGARADDPLGRGGWFATGRYLEGVERWRARLPAQVLGEGGLPADPRLARVVGAAAAHAQADPGTDAEREALVELGEALLDAGWFEEARRVADGLARVELDAALALATRAMAGAELVAAIDRLARDPTRGDGRAEGWALGGRPAPGEDVAAPPPKGAEAVGSLEALLARMARLVARANLFLGGTRDVEELERELAASPRITYGPFAELVHPGPVFSREDERLGRGVEGEPVPGLAQLMERLNRFAVFGEVLLGGGPDGVVLRRLLVEPRAGEHLGVRWGGTIAWCEGTDLTSRASRAGARISGAAVHEGYWIDVETLRPELARWRAVASRFGGAADDPRARRRLEQALATRGLALEVPAFDALGRERARHAIDPLLDQPDRLRLAVLASRAPAGELVGEIRFEELVEAVAVHEEGHLVDRALFLPLSRNPLRVARLLLDAGFSLRGVARMLEYRAQLVALCVAEDPRLVLVDVLEGAATTGRSPLEHGPAYRRLLSDLLRELDRAAAADPGRHAWLDRDRTLVHQLHRLPPDTLRALATRLARRHGIGR